MLREADRREMTLREVARRLGVSRETVRQDETRALAKMRAAADMLGAECAYRAVAPDPETEHRAAKRAAARAWYAAQPVVALMVDPVDCG